MIGIHETDRYFIVGDDYEEQQQAPKKRQPSSSSIPTSSTKTTSSSISASPSKPSYKAMPFIKAGEATKSNPLSLKRSKPMQEDEDDDEDDVRMTVVFSGV